MTRWPGYSPYQYVPAYVRSWYQLLTYVRMWLPHRKFIVHMVMFGHAYVRTYVFRVLRFSYMFLKQAGA